jgi:hypothetical protein
LLPGRSRPFQFWWYDPKLASSNNLLVTVYVPLNWNIGDRVVPPTVPVSGVASAAAPTTPI